MRRIITGRAVLYILAVIIIADCGTYWLLCRPELQMHAADAAGARYMDRVLSSAGGIWSLSPAKRCVVHLLFTTLVIFIAYLATTLVGRGLRNNQTRRHG